MAIGQLGRHVLAFTITWFFLRYVQYSNQFASICLDLSMFVAPGLAFGYPSCSTLGLLRSSAKGEGLLQKVHSPTVQPGVINLGVHWLNVSQAGSQQKPPAA